MSPTEPLPSADPCGQPCPTSFDPVCGNDGHTYANACAFQNAKCVAELQGNSLQILKPGPCGPTATNNQTSSGTDVGECKDDCPTALFPLCDSQGKTHRNPCMFEYEMCTKKKNGLPEITIAHDGPCQPKNAVIAQNQDCILTCNSVLSPVCDTNGKTHSNKCMFEYESCQQIQMGHEPLEFAYNGECRVQLSTKNVQLPATTTTRPRPVFTQSTTPGLKIFRPTSSGRIQPFLNTQNPVALTRPDHPLTDEEIDAACQITCPKVSSPLCDSKGKTFNNRCIFDEESCKNWYKTGSYLEIKHDGPCNVDQQETIELNVGPATSNGCVFNCTSVYQPLCDNRGKTHPNRCVFNYDNCVATQLGQNPLSVAKQGPCDNRTAEPASVEQRRGPVRVSLATLEENPCTDNCTEHYAPVCDNLNRTHQNTCKFNLSNCISQQYKGFPIHIVHSGACPNGISLESSIDSPTTIKTDNKQFVVTPKDNAEEMCFSGLCTDQYEPVCDVQGQTHENLCLFNYASCVQFERIGIDLNIANFGECRNDTVFPMVETCNKLKTCGLEFDPVCDENGQMHQNLCSFKEASCSFRETNGKGLTIANRGQCGSPTSSSTTIKIPSVSTTTETDKRIQSAPKNGTSFNPSNSIDTVPRKFNQPDAKPPPKINLPRVGPGPVGQLPNITIARKINSTQEGLTRAQVIIDTTEDRQIRPKFPDVKDHCTEDCTGESYAPLCDANGVTYTNLCEFNRFNCEQLQRGNGEKIIAYLGQCRNDTDFTQVEQLSK